MNREVSSLNRIATCELFDIFVNVSVNYAFIFADMEGYFLIPEMFLVIISIESVCLISQA